MAESAGSVGTRVVLDPRVLAVARSSTVVVRVAASSQPPGDDRPASPAGVDRFGSSARVSGRCTTRSVPTRTQPSFVF